MGAQAAIGLEQQTHPLQTLPPIQNSLKESEKVGWWSQSRPSSQNPRVHLLLQLDL